MREKKLGIRITSIILYKNKRQQRKTIFTKFAALLPALQNDPQCRCSNQSLAASKSSSKVPLLTLTGLVWVKSESFELKWIWGAEPVRLKQEGGNYSWNEGCVTDTNTVLRFETKGCCIRIPQRKSVPEFLDPVFAKTSPKHSCSLIENERFGLVFAKTGSINSGTRQKPSNAVPCGSGKLNLELDLQTNFWPSKQFS
jgi:hypothetical protein